MKRVLLYLVLFLTFAIPAHPDVYNTNPAKGLEPSQSVTVWSAETPTPGNGTTAASQQVALTHSQSGTTSFSVDGKFSGAPGVFEVDVQVAQTDTDTNYQTFTL